MSPVTPDGEEGIVGGSVNLPSRIENVSKSLVHTVYTTDISERASMALVRVAELQQVPAILGIKILGGLAGLTALGLLLILGFGRLDPKAQVAACVTLATVVGGSLAMVLRVLPKSADLAKALRQATQDNEIK